MSSILTFYSFKGGVGRTMALANTAILLARRGRKVLVVDWDLEAPGLHRYFAQLGVDSRQSSGLMDLLRAASDPTAPPCDRDWRSYVQAVSLGDDYSLSLITSGRQDDDYPRKVLEFDWHAFFKDADGGAFIERLREEWRREFDLTLIDSRTGITDAGGVCTIQLPDVLVPCFTTNEQSLLGAKDVALRAQRGRQRLAYDRMRLLVFPLLSRFDGTTEVEKAEEWLNLLDRELAPFYEGWLPRTLTPRQILDRTKVPYIAYFSFGETLPVVSHGTSDPQGLGYAYLAAATLIGSDFRGAERLVTSGPVASDPALWSVPHPRNPFFTGRDAAIAELRSNWTPGTIPPPFQVFAPPGAGKAEILRLPATATPAAAPAPILAIVGLAGVGKTQLALEYAYRCRNEYRAVLWAQADSRISLSTAYARIAELLGLPERHTGHLQDLHEAVKRWLAANTGYLLILDAVEDPAMVAQFLPAQAGGQVMITSRAQNLGPLNVASKIELAPMNTDEAVRFLLGRVGREKANSAEREAAVALSQELGGLPLALEQAAAFIESTQSSPAEYLALYRARGRELRERGGTQQPSDPEAVSATFTLALEKLEAASVSAAELLRLCAFLSPDAIPAEIFTGGAAELGDMLGRAAADPLDWLETLEAAGRYSLLQRDAGRRTFAVHRLVQAVLRDGMDAAARRQRAERAVRVVNRAFPLVALENWPQCERLLPHALTCAGWIETEALQSEEAARLLHQAGYYLWERGHYAAAAPLLERALAIWEQVLGPAHPLTATSLDNVARLYQAQGKLAEARPLFERALAIREQMLGPDHSGTAASLNNLATLYHAQGKLAEAEPLLQQALAVWEQKLGPVHPNTATSLSNLAMLYQAQGKLAEAVPLLQRALAIREEALGPEHPDMASSLNNLAAVYRAEGKLAEAEPLLRRALAIWEQVLGPEHPNTLVTVRELALLYDLQARYSDAEPLYRRALATDEQALGPEHPQVAADVNNLATLYYARGEYAQAEPLLQRALPIQERTLGPDHPDTASSLSNLAALYRAQGRYDEAQPLDQRALTVCEQALGPDHPRTALALNNLGAVYYNQERYEEARALLQRALAIDERVYGPEHPEVAADLNNLAQVHSAREQPAEVEALYRRALAIREKTLGANHPDTAIILNNLAALYDSQGRAAEAEPLYQRALTIYEAALGPDHPLTAGALNNLGQLYARQGRQEDAAPLLERAVAVLEKALGAQHPNTVRARAHYAALQAETAQVEP